MMPPVFNPTEAQLSTYRSRMERYGRVAADIVRPGDHGVMRTKLAADLAEVVLSSAMLKQLRSHEAARFLLMVEAICGALESPDFAIANMSDLSRVIEWTDAMNPESCPAVAYWRKVGWYDVCAPRDEDEVSDRLRIGVSDARELLDDEPACTRYGCVCEGSGRWCSGDGESAAHLAVMVTAWMDGFEAQASARGAA
ncbi:hypothetical protein [Microcystis phage Mae-JY24]